MSIASELLTYRNIELFGQRYFEENLLHSDSWDIKKVSNNWWEALKFFFSHSFFRGRRDKLSNEYYYFTIRTLEDHFCIPKEKEPITGEKLDRSYKKLRESEETEVAKSLRTEKTIEVKWDKEPYTKEKIYLGNETDVRMVLGSLNFISEANKKNIFNYVKREIANSRVKNVYDELDDIYGIGDKIASFTIRDVMLISSDLSIRDEDYMMAFPVDTWVRKIALELEYADKDDEKITDREIKERLIEKSRKFKVDPLKFAAGLWYLGANSLDLLLKN